MNELELWQCSACVTERTWGQRTQVSPETHHSGAWLFCSACKKTTHHRFTKRYKHVPMTYSAHKLLHEEQHWGGHVAAGSKSRVHAQ